MVVGTGIIEIWIANSNSLKDKRAVLRSLLKRTQNTFNVSIAEVGNQDNWRRAVVGFSVVGNEQSFVNGKVDKILNFVEALNLAEIVHSRVEIITISSKMGPSGFEEGKYGAV
jgi:hypothetical protein